MNFFTSRKRKRKDPKLVLMVSYTSGLRFHTLVPGSVDAVSFQMQRVDCRTVETHFRVFGCIYLSFVFEILLHPVGGVIFRSETGVSRLGYVGLIH